MKIVNRFPSSILLLGAFALLAIGSSQALAYPDWASGCLGCHGDFNSGTYVSFADGQNWGTDLMSGHMDNLIGDNDCDICHTAPGKSPVFLKSSDGGNGLDPVSCLGCHGREEGALGLTGTGLRQHHWNSGVAVCIGCHFDSDPGSWTAVGEDALPPYYANPGINHPLIPNHPCNPQGSEDLAGISGGGLDNDGDLLYDLADPDCAALPVEETTWGRIKAMYQ
jgi:hypothetical protein